MNFLKRNGLPTRKNEKWKNSPFPKQYEEDYLIDVPSASYDKNVNEIFHCEVHGFEAQTYSLLNGWYYSSGRKTTSNAGKWCDCWKHDKSTSTNIQKYLNTVFRTNGQSSAGWICCSQYGSFQGWYFYLCARWC